MRRAIALPAVLACLLGLGAAACGGGAGSDLDEVRVGVVPIADVAPLYLGREKGFFEAEGLDVEPRTFAGGAAITPAVLAGELEFGFSNTISLLIAASQGLGVQIVAQGALAGTDERRAWANLLVRGDGDIRTPADVEGRTVAVNTLNNICEITIKASLAKAGVDVSTLTFIEMPFAEMGPALQSGRADSACVVEPFLSRFEESGARGVDPFYIRTAPDLTVATYFTSTRYARGNPDVVDRFTRAMNRSLEYARRHPDEVRRILPSYTEISPALARRIRLPTWRADLNRPTIALLARLTERYGLIERQPDVDALIRPQP
jgi:NitT/TauT family transport system substrate-binding protein